MIFSQKDIDEIAKMFTFYKTNPNIELEARMSTFVNRKDIFPKNTIVNCYYRPRVFPFIPVIDSKIFFDVLREMDQIGFRCKKENSIDYSYMNDIRNTVIYGEQWENKMSSTWMKKTKIKQYTIFDNNIRVSLSKEEPIEDQHQHQQPEIIRAKERTSFFPSDDVKIDFTILTTMKKNDTQQRRSYEIEIECVTKKTCDVFLNTIVATIEQLQKTSYPMSLNAQNNIIVKYSRLIGFDDAVWPKLLGAQPETLCKSHVNDVKTDYAISEKYDGERYLMFVDDKYGYLMNKKMNFLIMNI